MGSIEAPGGETEVKAATSAGEALSLGRPRYHVVAPSGWMNDPCAPGYMPSSGEFNLMYQWNPYSHLWDNISWGQMRSKGLVKWEQVLQEPVFVPDQPYDQKGIFTGCLHPTSPAGDPNGLSIFYTSVPHIPIHWTTPHVRGQEGVALATSNDGGKTWQKDDNNPIVRAEPEHLDVTGFRDPSVIPWHTLDRLLGRRAGEGLYALISGGIQNLNTSDAGVDIASTTSSRCIEGQANEGPRLFLYDIDPNNLKSWRYLSTLGKTFPRNLIPHQWTGDFGANWECATVFSLRHAASGIERDVCILGVEGGGLRPHVQEYRKANPGSHERAARYAHWFFPSLSVEPGSAVADMEKVDMAYTTGGLVDWAELYAFATFPHPDGRRIGLGWLVELDLPDAMAEQKEWTGCLGLPREFELQVHGAVKGTLAGTPVEDIGSFEVVKGGNEEGNRVVTMGVRPLRELESLRGRAIRIPTCAPGEEEGVEMPECYELHLVTSITDTDSPMTITLRASPPASATDIRTTISFDPAKETIVINRAKSTTLAGLCLQDEVAPFTLLRFEDGSVEELDLRVFVDRDVIEVFVNGRVSLSTRVYAPKEANGLKVDVQGGAVVKLCEAWQMGDIGLPE